ncbi:hypothetical protein EPL59_22475 [Salmonella enterica subsp. enterica serovar Strasbourg]|uniref:Uncharacterized protein n=1 Tax=Salmonella enterica subsp. enterica serovar Strasbourg TaxID=682796 RepID=A0A5X7K8U4_SALET|nr:hypothetical protein [Salmonella enterica subsp. enterica serovar Strasbourg]ECB1045773.1 hypothetical protein [Salmonella enterica subsp. enterica serovar Aschersleben]ECI5768520.1 hypothetical protein [Salmonella enterica subsp. enterica]MID13572.1 hypothetical protein [Salmonella enterica]
MELKRVYLHSDDSVIFNVMIFIQIVMSDSTASHWRVVEESRTTLINTLKIFILQFKKANALILNINQQKVCFAWGLGILR